MSSVVLGILMLAVVMMLALIVYQILNFSCCGAVVF